MSPSRTRRLGARLLLFALVVGAPLAAQQGARYRVQRDTLYYRVVNPFRMYWMHGADTVGPRQHEVNVESQLWSGPSAHPTVHVALQRLDVSRWSSLHDFRVTPSGRLVMVDGAPPKADNWSDLLVPLPAVPLRVGLRWTDTTGSTPEAGPVGTQLNRAIREREVTRLFDTLGTRVAELRATGTWHMRLSFWVDSAAGRAAWLDVKGPMEEDDLIDIGRGRLLRQSWSMDLRGRGVPPSGGTDTVPAGLLSRQVTQLDDSPTARFLMRPLPGTDTAITLEAQHGVPILLHTVRREPGVITASMVRNDGVVGVARARFRADTVLEYRATWADSGRALSEQSVAHDGARLRVRRTGARDTVVAVPVGAWGVADYAMESLLGPELLALPRDGVPHAFAVYRPTPGRWDTGAAAVQTRAGLLLVMLRFDGGDPPEALVFTPQGDYLYGEQGNPTQATRLPLGAARQARLKQFLAALKTQ